MPQFNFLLKLQKPWEVDFRDSSIVADSMHDTIKSSSTIVLISLFVLLGAWCTINFFSLTHKKQQLAVLKNFISSNEVKHKKMLATNQEFSTVSSELSRIINDYKLQFNICHFLQDLMATKPDTIKFTTITAQSPSKIPQDVPFLIRLYGKLNDDITYLDTYNSNLMQIASLKTLEKGSKSFFQFDQNQRNLNNEVNFQLTIQSNE